MYICHLHHFVKTPSSWKGQKIICQKARLRPPEELMRTKLNWKGLSQSLLNMHRNTGERASAPIQHIPKLLQCIPQELAGQIGVHELQQCCRRCAQPQSRGREVARHPKSGIPLNRNTSAWNVSSVQNFQSSSWQGLKAVQTRMLGHLKSGCCTFWSLSPVWPFYVPPPSQKSIAQDLLEE